MLTVQIICVGKLKEGYLQQASAEYQRRLGAFCRLQIVELPEYKLPQNPSAAQIQKGIEQEGQSILHAMQKSQAFQIPLCIEGKERCFRRQRWKGTARSILSLAVLMGCPMR